MAERIGLLGGTFNPVHRGHVEIGLELRSAFALSRVLYILSAQPPHKRLQKLPPAEIRWQMLQEALAPHPGLEPCDIEFRRADTSWTIETLEEIRRTRPADAFFFICGSEGFLRFRTWKEYRRILEAAYFIVVLRQEKHRRPLVELLAALAAAGHDSPPAAGRLPPLPAAFLFNVPTETLAISSTRIRKAVRHGADIGAWVCPGVKQIIEEYRLYET